MGVLLSGFVAIALTQQLPPLFARTVNDAGSITEVEARADYIMNGYLEQSAKFSYYEAAYQVGNYTLAQSDPTTVVKFGSSHGGYDSRGVNDIKSFYEGYFRRIESEGSIFLYEYVNDLDSASNMCQIKKPPGLFDLGVVRDKPRIMVESPGGGPLIRYIACARPGITANYSVNKDRLELKTQNSHIHNMAIATSRALGGMWNESETIDGGADSGQVSASSACFTDGNAGNAQNNAKNQAEQDAYSQTQSLVDRIETRGENELQSVDSGNIGIPLLNAVMDLAYKGFDSTPGNGIILHDNQTSVSLASTTKVSCDGNNANCENWECSGNSGGSAWTTDGTNPKPNCEPTGSLGSPSCSVGVARGEYCDNTSATQSECSSLSDHTWQGGGICAYNNDEPCNDYDGYDVTEFGGSCVLNEPAPTATCTNWQKRWQSTYNYQLESVKFNTSVLDEARVPTSLSPNTRLPLKRRFIYSFN
ncbi:MAG: hypothetical protein ABEK10_02980 [Candidatus Nanosalina sp.]